jgi:hypothetical protein
LLGATRILAHLKSLVLALLAQHLGLLAQLNQFTPPIRCMRTSAFSYKILVAYNRSPIGR